MLPLLANPLPPPFGLVLVGVAACVPRTLLTPQFWTDAQCLQFAREDFDDARRRHAKLLAELSQAAGPVTGPAVAAPADLGAVENLWLHYSDGRFGYTVQKNARTGVFWLFMLCSTLRPRRASSGVLLRAAPFTRP